MIKQPSYEQYKQEVEAQSTAHDVYKTHAPDARAKREAVEKRFYENRDRLRVERLVREAAAKGK